MTNIARALNTRLFSRKQWLPDRFCRSQIKADPQLRVTTVTG